MIKNLLLKKNLLGLVLVPGLSFSAIHAMEGVPNEITEIFFKEHLSIQELGCCAQVSQTWNTLSSSDSVWDEHAQNFEKAGAKFECSFFYNITPSWKEILKKSCLSTDRLKERKKAELLLADTDLSMSVLTSCILDTLTPSSSYDMIKNQKERQKREETELYNRFASSFKVKCWNSTMLLDQLTQHGNLIVALEKEESDQQE